ncbi:MAG: TOBE domain-containing protein [Thermodesulfobacteriota bacterium]
MDSKKNGVLQPVAAGMEHGRIIAGPDSDQGLDTMQLERLEQSFREWVAAADRTDVRQSRRRILLIFLLIRYTGAKLNEVLAIDPFSDIDFDLLMVFFGRAAGGKGTARQVHVPGALCREIREALGDPDFRDSLQKLFDIDPAFVRRKFYERTAACGFAKRLGGPESIRKARAVEMMRGNMPLSAVQAMLGHSTPNLTSSYVAFSDEDIRELTRLFVERESMRKTSARNAFFGKIAAIRRGDIQSRVELTTISGHSIVTTITNDSLERLVLREGRLITAEVKAPWVTLQKGAEKPISSAENIFHGVVTHINQGEMASEYVLRIADGNELCAIVSSERAKMLGLREQERVWALFNSYSVVLHLD